MPTRVDLVRYREVRIADLLDDQKTAAEILGAYTASETQEDLQLYVLSQLKRIIFGDAPGEWKSDFTAAGIKSLTELTAGGGGGGATNNITTQSANYTAAADDYFINCITNSFTVTLPSAVGATGRTYVVKNSGSGTVVTIAAAGGEVIDGSPTAVIVTQYAALNVISDGANWLIF